jgi:hypothetical protein
MTKPDFHALMHKIDECDAELASVGNELELIRHRYDMLEAQSQALHCALALMGGEDQVIEEAPRPKRKRRTKAEIAAAKANNGHAQAAAE